MKFMISILSALLLIFLISAPAVAQAPAPDPEPNIGSLLVSYNLSDLEPGVTNRLSGISLEADLKIPGTVLSVVGHVSDHGEVRFQGAGPRVTHNLGPLSIFGHYLFGNLSAGGAATAGLDAKKGGGIEIPVYKRAVLRIGADHDGTTLYSVVGFGFRF